MSKFGTAKRIVIKVGSSSITYDNGMPNMRQMEKLCDIISDIKNSGRQVILVSSGAIAVGTGKLGLGRKAETIPEKQAAAAVGQVELMYMYDKLFANHHHQVGQILLTRDVFENEERCTHAINTMETILAFNTIPIVNENDTIAVEEIQIGDNDTLSALVASIVKADGLIILSDIDGLFEEDPHKNPNAKIIPYVNKIDDYIEGIAGGAGSNRGTGGMATKIAAAKICFEADCAMAIINSNNLEGIYSLTDGKSVGTIFEKEGN